jgi:hypothetical protein
VPATLFRLGPLNSDRDQIVAFQEIEMELQRLGELVTQEIDDTVGALTFADIGGALDYIQLPSGGGTWANAGDLTLTGGRLNVGTPVGGADTGGWGASRYFLHL